MDYRYELSRSDRGVGTLLSPPGHPDFEWTVKQFNKMGPKAIHGEWPISYAAGEDPEIPEHMRRAARKKIEQNPPVCSEGWLRHVYGYMRNMYSLDGKPWTDAGKLVQDPDRKLPPEYHAGVIVVRRHFPDHQPRPDLIDPAPGTKLYGAYPCVHCGRQTQYEARIDKLTVFNESGACPKSESGHSWE